MDEAPEYARIPWETTAERPAAVVEGASPTPSVPVAVPRATRPVSAFDTSADALGEGAPAQFPYKPDHKLGMVVPVGGSSCGNCKFLAMKEDGPHCANSGWVDWPKERGGGGGDGHLPVNDPTTYCCDLWGP
jgi:hypothetical protein